ncbi:MAG: hypothetical protein Kow00124_28650 [Anaerolineae bacterium]
MTASYDTMSLSELTNLLLYVDQDPEVVREVLSALSRRDRGERNPRLVAAIEHVLKFPDRYNQQALMGVIDILATDPHPDATVAMIDLLPEFAAALLDRGQTASPEFREYFFQALLTRQRDSDLEVWAEMLPTLDPKTLVSLIADPAACELALELEPLTLIDRMAEPNRTKALVYAISCAARHGTAHTDVEKACDLLRGSHSIPHFQQGRDLLRQQAKKAREANQHAQARMLNRALDRLR